MRSRRPFVRAANPSRRRKLSRIFALLFAERSLTPALADCVPFTLEATFPPQAASAQGVSAFPFDSDRDGDVDLHWESPPAKFLRAENDGTGHGWTLQTSAPFLGSANVAADVDGDGDLDRFRGSSPYLSLEETTQSGAGVIASNVTNSAQAPFSLRSADLDGDGLHDLLSVENDHQSLVWYAHDSGAPFWPRATILETPGEILRAGPGDVDRDGDLDVMVTYDTVALGQPALVWLENDGSGGSWALHTVQSTGLAPGDFPHLADIDRDGDLDVISTRFSALRIDWLENDGSGGGWTAHTMATGQGLVEAFAADLDGDGDSDFAGVGSESLLHWFENRAGGAAWVRHTLATALDVGASGYFGLLWGSDVDLDGDTDVLVVPSPYATFSLLRNGRPVSEVRFDTAATIAAPLDGPNSLAVADLDRDGDLDLGATSGKDDSVSWIENRGGGWSLHLVGTAADGASSVAISDLDRDGDPDLVSSSAGDGEILWYENDGAPAASAWSARTVTTRALGTQQVVVADLDRDGDPDLLSAESGHKSVVWYEHDGDPLDGGWKRHTATSTVTGVLALSVADLDGDGEPDFAAVAPGISKLSWFRNDGTPDDGEWTETVIATALSGPTSLAAADLDRDGDRDLVVALSGADQLVLYRNADGEGSAWSAATIGTALVDPVTLRLGDVDGDGDLDLVAAATGSDRVDWFENDGSGSGWTAHGLAPAVADARGLALGDLDGDGRLDVATTSELGDSVLVALDRGERVFGDGFDDPSGVACWSSSTP